ncbi:MAG TPA: pre-peptidase C-terminal domain-containing protein [Thermoanaerobaculia bacterium]|nr:pre-peptidase C-terminal domain-containing protein [Thermoanaerobaculia bacterium]
MRSALDVSSTWASSSTVPAGFTVTVTPSSFTLAPGESRTVQITVEAPPGSYGWREGVVVLTPSGGVAPPARLPVAARWVPEYQLTVDVAGGGSGRVTSSPPGIDCGTDCTELYPEETLVTLTPVPSPGSVFAGWSDGWSCGTGPGCTFEMSYPRWVTAYFTVPAPDRLLANGTPLRDSLHGYVENGTWSYYYIDVPAGTAELVVDVLDLTGEVSLFVRQGAKPTGSDYNCYDAWWGGLSRRCVVSQPAAGRWWIGLNNEDTGNIAFSVRAAWGTANGSDRLLTNGLVAGDFLTASSSGEAWKYYFFDVESGATNLTVELADLSGDVDLLVRRGAKPDRSTHDCDSSQGSTLTERCSFANPQPGRWWVAVNNFGTGTLHFKVRAGWTTPPTSFYTVQPCRVLDTRSSSPLVPGPSRIFQVTGACGIPATARAVVANVTAVLPTGQGHVTLHPGNQPPPLASSVNFRAGQVRANNGILNLPADGGGALGASTALLGGGHVHLLVDVTGYFQ